MWSVVCKFVEMLTGGSRELDSGWRCSDFPSDATAADPPLLPRSQKRPRGPAAFVRAAAWVWLRPFPGMGRKPLGLVSHAYSTVTVKEPLL